MKPTKHLAIIAVSIAMSSSLFAQNIVKSVRANELTPQIWNEYNKGEIQELLIEFQQGDKLPVTFQAEGDLLETTEANPSYVTVQRSFWVQMKQNSLQLSLDGTHFKPFKKLIAGSLSVGAGAGQQGGIANSINIGFKAMIK
jgi:hypothetical protein